MEANAPMASLCRHCSSNLGARKWWVVNATPRPLYPRERPDTHCIGSWVIQKAGLDEKKKMSTLTPRIRSPDGSARRESPYQLSISYPGRRTFTVYWRHVCFLWPRGLRSGFAAAHLLGLRVRIPPGEGRLWCEYCVLSVRSICNIVCCQVEVSAILCVVRWKYLR